MTEGSVNDRLQATLPVQLLDASGQPMEGEAFVDTGFSGFLTLSGELVNNLGLSRVGGSEARLGNGEIVQFATYAANVLWNGQRRMIVALQSNAGTLIGMSLLKNSRLTIDVLTGGKVSVAPLTSSS